MVPEYALIAWAHFKLHDVLAWFVNMCVPGSDSKLLEASSKHSKATNNIQITTKKH